MKYYSSRRVSALFAGIILALCLVACGSKAIEKEAIAILEEDLGESVQIISLYYNEGKSGCFAEIKTGEYTDVAAIQMDSEAVDYESEFDFYSILAEQLRKQNPINETALHECNNKILNSAYAEWHFEIVAFEANGTLEENGWEKIK